MAYWYNTHNGMSDFKLYNQRLKSHEAHCHGNYGGSIWNCMGGIGIGGFGMCTGGGFWNSLKTGLGFGLASGLTNLLFAGAGRLFGGLFSGGLGLGSGMFGLGGLGGGNWLGGGVNGQSRGWLSGLFGGRKADGAPQDDEPKTVEKENADQAKINEIDTKANEIILTKMKNLPNDSNGLNALQKEINDLLNELNDYEKEDDINTEDDNKQIANIKDRLEACNTRVAGAIQALPPANDGDAAVEEGGGEVGNENNGTINLNGTPTNINDIKLDDIQDITSNEFNDLDSETKEALLAKIDDLLEGATNDNEKNDLVILATNEDLPSEIRSKVKSSFYQEGLTNVTQAELTEEALAKLTDVIDTSVIGDFEVKSVTNIQKNNAGNITSFKMTAQSAEEVTYNKVSVIDGELIFHGINDNQQYVIQKEEYTKEDGTTDYKLKLMQYDYHKGHGSPDYTSQA